MLARIEEVRRLLSIYARVEWRRAQRTWARWRDLRREDWLPVASRYGAHLLVVALALVVAGVGLPARTADGWPAQYLAQAVDKPDTAAGVSFQSHPNPNSEPTFMVPLALPNTIIPKRGRRGIVTYIVQPGDLVHSIAKKFEITAGTLMWANPDLERNPDLLIIGQELIILPINGVYHTIKKGDTIEAIAEKYSIEPQAIWDCEFNDKKMLETLPPGEKIIAPGGKKPYVPRPVYVYSGPVPKNAKRGTGVFGWPTSGVITQGYWVAASGHGHRAIDIANPSRPFVRAADSGFVIKVARNTGNTGYGNYVMIDHRNGFVTLYAHLDTILVNVGDSVGKGAILGRMGNTGKVRGITGLHLHFEIIKNGVRRNPMLYLR
jgi:LysM repeat protein